MGLVLIEVLSHCETLICEFPEELFLKLMDPQGIVSLQSHQLMLLVRVLAEEEHSHVVSILLAHALRRQLVIDNVILRRLEIVQLCKLVKFNDV